MARHLNAYMILRGKEEHLGLLYLRNDRVIVMINNVRDAADLGPLKSFRSQHCEPEADIKVFPRELVNEMRLMTVRGGMREQ